MLVDAQSHFTMTLARFLLDLKSLGYQVTLGESYRPPETAKMYAIQGKGIANSLHCDRLAQDLNIFKDAVLLNTFDDLLFAGELWESLSEEKYPCNWGGRFTRPDCDHYSISIDSRK